MNGPHQIFDTELAVRRRERAAAGASAHQFLLDRVAEDLAERLGIVKRDFPVGLNLGAYHGVLSRRLAGLSSVRTMIDLEAAPSLLARCPGATVLAQPELLPFGDNTLDLVVSGLALQLINDLPGTLLQIRRALKPDGLLLAAMLGGETLTELRQAWLAAEDEIEGGASPRVAPFADLRDVGALLQRAGFALPVVDSDLVRVTYPTPLALMRELKAMGASNMLAARRRKPIRRETLVRASIIYQEKFGLTDGRIPATFEIITLTAWAPHESQQKPLRPGSATARLADALGVTEMSAGERPEQEGS